MKQSIINEAQNIIRKRKESAEKLANVNKNKALQDSKFASLNEEYITLMIENAKLEAYGKKIDKSKLDDLQNKIKQRLTELKIDSIAPKYQCEKCSDTGQLDNSYCDCLKQEISKILLKKSGFEKLNEFKDSNFNIFENKEEMKKIYEVMQTWCNKKDTNKNLVYLLGNTGTGKTHLMSCMANDFIKQNKIVLLTTAFNLSQLFLKFHTTKEKEGLLNDILSCEILFIDDLGTEPFFNNITKEYTYLVINERRMKNLKTVITSNLTPRDLKERYDERIFSRVMDKNTSIVIELKGADKRLRN